MPRAKKKLDARTVVDTKNKIEITRINENQEEVREYTRVQKGMVFYFRMKTPKLWLMKLINWQKLRLIMMKLPTAVIIEHWNLISTRW